MPCESRPLSQATEFTGPPLARVMTTTRIALASDNPIDFAHRGKSANQCPAPFAKIFRFTSDPNHLHISRIPAQHRGAFRDRHGRRVGMRWTRVARLTSALHCGRRSRVVLTPRRWCQVGGNNFRWRRWQTSPVTEESSKQPLKPSRAGMPGDPGATVVTNARAYYSTRAAAGATGTRHSPLPSWGSAHAFV